MSENLYDTIIIGGGPAATGAAVYADRKRLKAFLICEEFGGQSSVSANIDNWIGEVTFTGFELSEKLQKHVRAQKDIRIMRPRKLLQ